MTREDIEKEISSRLDEPDNEWDSIFNSGFSRGFIAATEWRINSIWKDASIEPTEKKMLVIFDRIGDMWECDYLTDPMPNYAWKVFVKEAAVLRWAYKEDLLPNKEE